LNKSIIEGANPSTPPVGAGVNPDGTPIVPKSKSVSGKKSAKVI
jgi:hypothetical protein